MVARGRDVSVLCALCLFAHAKDDAGQWLVGCPVLIFELDAHEARLIEKGVEGLL